MTGNTASAATRTTIAIGSRTPNTPRPAPEPGAPAGARRISQDGPRYQHAGLPRGGPLHAVRRRRSPTIGFDSRCARCGTDLHACAQCGSFDPGSRFECMQTIPAGCRRRTRERLHPLLASHHRRTRNDRPAHRRRPQGVRRLVQVLGFLGPGSGHARRSNRITKIRHTSTQLPRWHAPGEASSIGHRRGGFMTGFRWFSLGIRCIAALLLWTSADLAAQVAGRNQIVARRWAGVCRSGAGHPVHGWNGAVNGAGTGTGFNGPRHRGSSQPTGPARSLRESHPYGRTGRHVNDRAFDNGYADGYERIGRRRKTGATKPYASRELSIHDSQLRLALRSTRRACDFYREDSARATSRGSTTANGTAIPAASAGRSQVRLRGPKLRRQPSPVSARLPTVAHRRRAKAGGEGGIRTPDTLSGTAVFKTAAINHSATSPLISV